MKKFITFVLIILMVSFSTFIVFAESTDAPITDDSIGETFPEDTPTEDKEDDPVIDENIFKQWLTEWQDKYEADQAGKESPDTFAEWILMQILTYGTEILAALAALFALINAFYSRAKIKKPFDRFTKQTSQSLTEFTNDVSNAVETYGKDSAEALSIVRKYAASIESLETEVKDLHSKQIALEGERKALLAAFKLQSEMLNTVIQSSSMAQWKKDQIGQLHTNATARINELSSGGDNK